MNQRIDERVVEMRFDNKEFESAAKESLSTIDKLKKALNLEGAAKGFENVDKAAKNMDLHAISEGIAALQDRFSTLGIVGMRVIENITDSMMNMASKAMGFVSDAIISGGLKRAQNIENAHFQLQALLKDEEKVQAVMDNAMVSVDGTAYAYDEAAKAAAQFAASGMEAGEKMVSALRGITGVAAMTNSEYESISMIFTTVAGNGRLMGDQLLQLASRGLNAAATLADYFKEVRGQSEMTEAQIREMVTKGQIDFETFASAMDWAFGESAFRANETFTGAFANMKSAFARIGAGFFSPLIEQNSDLVLVINALRERINDVKKELVFDEQTSAVAGLSKMVNLMTEDVSNLVKNGSIDFNTLTSTILGTSKSEEELKSINEKLAESYNKVKESGSASVETLIDFNKSGINATKSIQDYINGVLDGTIKVSDAVKTSIKEITEGNKLVTGDVTRLAEEGKISYDIFTDAIANSSASVQENTKLASDAIKAMMNQVKEQGVVTTDSLIQFNKNGINAASALKDYMNGVMDGSVRASYATKQAIEEITGGTKVASGQIAKFAEEGKISYAIFQSAMEEAYGETRTLSKRFTDFFLDNAKAFQKWLKELDVSKPMDIFYNGVDSVINISKAFLGVLTPIGDAFQDTFLKKSPVDAILVLSEKIKQLTSTMRLSEKGTEDLHDAFQGIFSVVKLVTDAFFGLFGIVVPVSKPIGSLTDLILALAGAMGRALTKGTEWINNSTLLNKAYNFMAEGVQNAMTSLAKLIAGSEEFAKYVYNLPIVQKIVNKVIDTFTDLYEKGELYLPILADKVKDLGKTIAEMIPDKTQDLFDKFIKSLKDMKSNLEGMNLEKVRILFDKFVGSFESLLEVFKGTKGLDTFISNTKEYFDNLLNIFSFDTLLDHIDNIKERITSFMEWIAKTVNPILENFSFGGAVAASGGFAIIYALVKAMETLEKVTGNFKVLPDTLKALKSTLEAYQKNLQADTMVKIATAIAILAGALTILSFADVDRVYEVAIVLGLAGAALIAAVGYLERGIGAMNSMNATIYTVGNTFAKSLNNLAKAVKWKAIGAAFKDMAIAVGIIVASILVVAYAYSKDSADVQKAVELIVGIGVVMAALMAGLSYLGKVLDEGMKNFAKAAAGILALSVSLVLVLVALKQLFALEIPDDWPSRLLVLTGVYVGLIALTLAVGTASKIANGNSIKTGPILAMAAGLYLCTLAVKKILTMDLPEDWKSRLWILAAIFGGFSVAILAVGVAGKLSKDGLKATGTILAMCAFIATTVAALGILTLFPVEKLIGGAVGLGITLIALAVALAGAGQIAGKDTWKSILAMAIEIGAIVAALGVLSMLSAEDLRKSGTALGAILLILAGDLLAASKITDKLTFASILAMAANIGIIALSLYALATQPWEGMIIGATALATVLVGVAGAFAIMEKVKPDMTSIATFLSGTVGVIMIAMAISMLANEPWEGMAAAAGSISAVLMALSASFAIMSKTKVNMSSFAGFIGGAIGIAVIGVILAKVAEQPWQNLLGAAASLSLVLTAMSAAMILCAVAGNLAPGALAGIALLDLFIANVALILLALGALSEDAEAFLDRGGEILKRLGTYLGEFVGNIIGGVLTGVTSSLPQVGKDLSEFAANAELFFDKVSGLDNSVITGVKNLAQTIIILTAAEILNGIAGFLGGGVSFSSFKKDLEDLGDGIAAFGEKVRGIDGASVEAAANSALVLSQLYSHLPKESGWMQVIVGEQKSLAEFAQELIPFGVALVAYSSVVSGNIDQDAVNASIEAAKVLAAFADTLPDMGGLAGLIFGNQKTLAEFAQELIPFGVALVAYSSVVAGKIDQGAIEASINAAEVLAAFADTLPDMGGLKDIIFGHQKTLAEFAQEIIPFGVAMAAYSAAVAGKIDHAAVEASAAAASALVELQNGLGDSGGLFSLFTGEKSLAALGQEIAVFGSYLATYSETVSTVDIMQLEAVIQEVWGLIAIANATAELDTSGMTGFALALETMGLNGIEAFILAFTNSLGNVIATIDNFTSVSNNQIMVGGTLMSATALQSGEMICTSIIQGINSKQSLVLSTVKNLCTQMISTMKQYLPQNTFTTIGQNVIQWVINGENSKKSLLLTTVKNLCTNMISQFKTSLPQNTFVTIGQNVIQWIINGQNNMRQTLLATVQSICNAIITQYQYSLPQSTFTYFGQAIVIWISDGINSMVWLALQAAADMSEAVVREFDNHLQPSRFHEIGQHVAEGLADGIRSEIDSIADAAISAAEAAIEAAKSKLGVHSPSRVFHLIGENVDQGMAMGIISKTDLIYDASEEAANETVSAVSGILTRIRSIFEDNEDLSPVVTPIMDLTNVRRGVEDITAMFNKMDTTYEKVLDASSGFKEARVRTYELRQQEEDPEYTTNEKGRYGNYFEQNIYSPKPLSRSEIYRDTKNLFSTATERVVSNG